MNNTSKLNEAMQINDFYGTDPDNIMMLTTKEWADAKNEKLDNDDEKEKSLKQISSLTIALDQKIALIKTDIEATENLMQKYSKNYQMKYEYQQELNELNRELNKLQRQKEKLLENYQELKDSLEQKFMRR